MKIIKLFLLNILVTLLLYGCLQVDTQVNVNQDGSGTIEETVLIKKEVIDMIREFAMSFDSTKTEEFNMFNVEELSKKASNYGEGVKYLSGEKYSVKGSEGYKAVYSFKDINKLMLNPSPEDKIPFGDDAEQFQENISEDILKFNFTKGNPSTLIITFPEQKKKVDDTLQETGEFEDSTFSDEEMNKLTEMFDGFKFSVSLNMNNNIQETDASFVEGDKVTLMQVDFTEIIKNKDVLQNLNKAKPETMAEFREIVGSLEGIKFEFKDKITIKF